MKTNKMILTTATVLGLATGFTLSLTMNASAQTCDPRKYNANRTDLHFLVGITDAGLMAGDIFAVRPAVWYPAFTSQGYDQRIEAILQFLAINERQARYVNQMTYFEETRVKLGGRPINHFHAITPWARMGGA